MIKDINNILLEYNLSLIKFENSRNVFVEDKNGYKYKLNITNLKNRRKLPHLFRRNPFVIDNIKNYLKLNDTGLTLLSSEYIDCKHKLAFICNKHKDNGVQYKTLDSIINDNQYCKYCGIEKRAEKSKVSDDIIRKRCDELGLIYIGRYTKNKETWVQFKCNKHLNKGVQDISWYHFKTCSVGCAYCTGRYKNTEDFIQEIHNINPNILIIGEYAGSENPVKCKCKICNHEWSPIGRSLKNGQGCPLCTCSKGELEVKRFLDYNNLEYIRQKTFDDCIYKEKLRFDFYLLDYNILIEYDGEQHFMPVDFANKGIEWAVELFELNKIKDRIKNNYCYKNNIKLIRIPYWDFKNIESILTSELSDVFLF